MNQHSENRYKSGMARSLAIAKIAFALLICASLYLVLFQGTLLMIGRSIQLYLVLILLPALLAALVFRLAEKVDHLNRLNTDE